MGWRLTKRLVVGRPSRLPLRYWRKTMDLDLSEELELAKQCRAV